MIKTVANNADALGYSFWGYGNFTTAYTSPAKLKYLTVNGVDPLYANSGSGANPNGTGVFPVPTGTSPNLTYPTLSFPNINNGTYRVWTTFRFLVPNADTATGENASAWAQIFTRLRRPMRLPSTPISFPTPASL